ncbi:MAG: histone deacetylase [Hyphomicrobiaceae bacterium]
MTPDGDAMNIYYPATEELPLPEGHRFPAAKYRALLETVLSEKIFAEHILTASPPASEAELLLAHDAAYVTAVMSGTLTADAQRRIGLPWSPILAARARAVVGGTIAAARSAMQHGLSGQLAGGTHHAHAGFGSGYCTFNDLAVAALAVRAAGAARRIAILDLDVHQGDGTAAILAGDKAPDVLTVSVHGERNFPFRKVASDLDIALADGTEDTSYLGAVADALAAVASFRPDLVLYQAGVDGLASDTLGRLALTHEGLAERDRIVIEHCRRRGVAIAIVAGGGYAQPISETVRAYAATWRVAAELFGLDRP